MTQLYFSGTIIMGTSAYAYLLPGICKKMGVTKRSKIEAEYIGLIKGLKDALDLDLTKVTVLGPKLVIDQINGNADVYTSTTHSLYNEVMELLSKFRKVDLGSVSNKRNKAHVFSIQALVEFFEGKAAMRSKRIMDKSIKRIENLRYLVHGHAVDIGNQTCTCPWFSKINIPEIKRLGFVIRCEHVFAVERFASI